MISKEKNPDYLNSFLDYSITILNKSPNSVKEYNYDLSNFLKFMMIHFKLTDKTDYDEIDIRLFTVKDLKRITLNDIHTYISHLAIDNKSKASTRARKISTIRIFFKFLSIKEKILEVNPAQNLETPKLEKRMPKYLSLEDSRKLLEVADNDENRNAKRDFAITTLFLNCGMRLSELVGININDIDFSECKMTVIGKGNKERTIYLNKSCMKALNDYISSRPPQNLIKKDAKNSDKALFLSEQKRRISNRTVQNIISKELKQAGLDSKNLSVHKLRHTAATLMYQYGDVDIRALQELLGHQSISTTEIYTHVNNERVRNAVESNPLNDK
ncbi:MAG: tyrosine recombinase XerC [Clostridia bacterium]|nr:tyrosine recombinase XerC [Clostridia bacterium]